MSLLFHPLSMGIWFLGTEKQITTCGFPSNKISFTNINHQWFQTNSLWPILTTIWKGEWIEMKSIFWKNFSMMPLMILLPQQNNLIYCPFMQINSINTKVSFVRPWLANMLLQINFWLIFHIVEYWISHETVFWTNHSWFYRCWRDIQQP